MFWSRGFLSSVTVPRIRTSFLSKTMEKGAGVLRIDSGNIIISSTTKMINFIHWEKHCDRNKVLFKNIAEILVRARAQPTNDIFIPINQHEKKLRKNKQTLFRFFTIPLMRVTRVI